jgi:hypothetical protein
MGFAKPQFSRAALVGFYPTVSPLPQHRLHGAGGLFSVALSIGFAPAVRVVSHELGLLAVQPLAGITPFDARTFLTLRRDHAPFQAARSVAHLVQGGQHTLRREGGSHPLRFCRPCAKLPRL